MPGRLWKFSKAWTAGCQCGMKAASSLPRKRRPTRYSSETVAGVPHPFLSHLRAPTAWANLGPRLSDHWTQGQSTRTITVRSLTPWPPASKPKAAAARKPTFLQKERWKAIQKARRKGMSLRAIERDLGINRATVRKYLDSEGPPTRPPRAGPTTSASDTMAT